MSELKFVWQLLRYIYWVAPRNIWRGVKAYAKAWHTDIVNGPYYYWPLPCTNTKDTEKIKRWRHSDVADDFAGVLRRKANEVEGEHWFGKAASEGAKRV
jgi:hypothetical protein